LGAFPAGIDDCRDDRDQAIPAWKKRADQLFQERNSAKALKKYRTFMDETADLRDQIDEATSQVDTYIDEQIDRAREARYFKE
jgi:hypothetical protein